MALIQCLPPSPTRKNQEDIEDIVCDHDEETCECSVDELNKMDAWSKMIIAIKVLTAFKKRRRKKLDEEKAMKEKRKTLWKRLGFKLRIFNMFARKISADNPTEERLIKLKRKLGNTDKTFLILRKFPRTLQTVTTAILKFPFNRFVK